MKLLFVSLYDLYSYGIRGLQSYVLEKGFDAESIFFKTSTYTDNYPKKEELKILIEEIVKSKPDMICFSLRSPLFPIFKFLSTELRKKLSCLILVGGHHPTAAPDTLLGYADFIIMGEGELPLLNVLNNNSYIHPKKGFEYIEDLDSLPIEYFGKSKYLFTQDFSLEEDIHLYSMRGCPYQCSYCHESVFKPKRKIRRKSVNSVLEDIKQKQKLFPNAKEIVFSDQVFTLGDRWLDEFCEKWPRKVRLPFRALSHFSHINREKAKKLKEAGIHYLSFGIQSASPKIRDIYNRKGSLDEIVEKSHMISEEGIYPRYDFIVDSPFDTSEDLKLNREFIKKLGRPATIRNFQMRFFPSTPLTQKAIGDGMIRLEDVEGNSFCKFGNWMFSYEVY